MNPALPFNTAPELVDHLISEAIRLGASDIYWLPLKERYETRIRVDGIQRDLATVTASLAAQCVNRIKSLSGLLTYRSNIDQDGVIRGMAGYPDIELRVASMPTIHGERLTIRIPRRTTNKPHVDDLGLPVAAAAGLKEALERESGLIVLTGPTGSGKTTTIYALVRELIRGRRDPASIITIEDPVECDLEGVSQVSLSRSGEEWRYPEALRAALRQDVKTLVVGEMRDREVVRVALEAALTGHRVITTFHGGDIPSVYARMLHQGFEPFLVASAVTGVLAQRLLRRQDGEGRSLVAAFLKPSDEWREFIIRNPCLTELRRKILEIPHADLRTVALGMAEDGVVAEEEARLI